VRGHKVMQRIGCALAVWLLALLALATPGGVVVSAAAQPTAAAQDEFVPIDALPTDEQLPAAPLVLTAYAIAWIIVLAYLWSIWQRLGRVERELAEVTRRVEGTTRPPIVGSGTGGAPGAAAERGPEHPVPQPFRRSESG
jgi:CcmD family protein